MRRYSLHLGTLQRPTTGNTRNRGIQIRLSICTCVEKFRFFERNYEATKWFRGAQTSLLGSTNVEATRVMKILNCGLFLL